MLDLIFKKLFPIYRLISEQINTLWLDTSTDHKTKFNEKYFLFCRRKLNFYITIVVFIVILSISLFSIFIWLATEKEYIFFKKIITSDSANLPIGLKVVCYLPACVFFCIGFYFGYYLIFYQYKTKLRFQSWQENNKLLSDQNLVENNFSKDYDSSIQTNLTEKHKFILLKTDEEFKDYEMMPSTKRFKYNNKFFIKSEDNKNDLFYMFLVCNIEKLVVDGKKATLEMFREEAIKYLDLKLN